jgi:hypothetical protein
MISFGQAILALQPTAEFMLPEQDYATLIWLSPDVPKPTEDAILAKKSELEAAQPMVELREKRNELLAETDYLALSDVTMSDEMQTYRQALRDLPANTSDPANPTWPTKPGG